MNDTKRQRERLAMLQWAMRIFLRNRGFAPVAWAGLFEWARLGGKREEGTR